LRIGDAAEIWTKRVRKQKTDRQDAQLILRLLLGDRFPQIWVPSWENRDLRQLLWHRHRMVQARNRCVMCGVVRCCLPAFSMTLWSRKP
jgi:transposase